jgi:cell division protein FtsB
MKQRLHSLFQRLSAIDARTVGLLAILLVAVSVTYSSAKIIHKNYQLEQQITVLQQENALQEQINKNQKLTNEYYKTDAYLDLAARKFFNKAAPGEVLVLVPEEVAMSYTTPPKQNDTSSQPRKTPEFITNWRKWLDFLSGKPISSES